MKILLTAAIEDLRACSVTLIRYVAASFLALGAYRLILHALDAGMDAEIHANLLSVVRLCMALYLAIAGSLIQAVFFAELGAQVDRPIWKYAGPRDAMRRFFVPWLIINLSIITLIDIRSRLIVVGQTEAGALFDVLLLVVHLGALPVGACIMHWGALEWNELGAALRPLVRFIHLLLVPIAVAFIQFALLQLRAAAIVGNDAATFMTLVLTDIPLFLLDALIFVLAWRICMIHRNEPEEESDPFDL